MSDQKCPLCDRLVKEVFPAPVSSAMINYRCDHCDLDFTRHDVIFGDIDYEEGSDDKEM